VGTPRYLTVAEVGALLRASKMTVYRLVHAGAPEAVRIGGRSMSPSRQSARLSDKVFARYGLGPEDVTRLRERSAAWPRP
jgi:excisionase family DNA binding protein